MHTRASARWFGRKSPCRELRRPASDCPGTARRDASSVGLTTRWHKCCDPGATRVCRSIQPADLRGPCDGPSEIALSGPVGESGKRGSVGKSPVSHPPTKRSLLWFLGWPFRFLLINMVRGYRKWISPGLPPSCRYHPSCSTYGLQALQTHGAAKGLALTSWRIVKCNPFTEGGVNPIPPKGKWRSDMDTAGNPRGVTSDSDKDGVDSKAVSFEGSVPSKEPAVSVSESQEAGSQTAQAVPVSRGQYPARSVSCTEGPGRPSRADSPTGRLYSSQAAYYSQSGA